MLNQLVIVGRLWAKKPDRFILAVSAPYKNKEGAYDTYRIEIFMKGNIAQNVKEYCKKGDILGVKGHIETHNKIYAEKISFLSSGPRK